jgi:putative chitobiose transport system substrate-binding protein
MSKNAPDLINMNPSFASTLASRGALIDLREYINSDQLDVYLKESWAASALKENIFGIPWYITSSITVYNTELLADAGINADNIPKTYEELGVLAEKIKEKTGKYAFMPNLTEDGHMLKIFNKYDVPIISDDRTKALFNTLKAQEILSFWVDLYEKKHIPPESLTEAHRASLEKFQAGESAFIFSGANFLKIISENAPQVYKNTSVAPQITGSIKKSILRL